MEGTDDAQLTATQPELKQLMNDIFGLSDDEEDDTPVRQPTQPPAAAATVAATGQSDDAQLFDDDSDADEAAPVEKRLSRFTKGKKDSQKARVKSTEPKKRKRADKPKTERKRKEQATGAASASSSADVSEQPRKRADDEDSYASESELDATAEDKAFIDTEGDDAELMREYAEENPQNFDDERPDRRRQEEEVKEISIVDEAVLALKKPKPVELARDDRQRIAQNLVDQMRQAAEADKESRQNQRPALEKLRLLPQVRHHVLNRQLQEDLLEYNLLTAFRAWLEPPAQNELPTLELRAAIYKMLDILPIEASHLKDSQVGQIVMALYRHPKENMPHKKMLERIIQKWSRMIFVSGHQDREVEQPIRRPSAEPQQNRARQASRLGAAGDRNAAAQQQDTFGRVHVPISRGFNFKVRPDSNVAPTVAAAATEAKSQKTGGVKARLLKKSGSRGVDKNFRAERVSIGGRDHVR